MKGHVPTPDDLAEQIVRRLFRDVPPTSDARILYPGCGSAPFAAAVERVCDAEGWTYPEGLGVETNPEHLEKARARGLRHVEFEQQDYLADEMRDYGPFTYIVGNPPYVPIEGLSEEEKERYKSKFRTAVGRFDLYLLFFERSRESLAPDGTLSFVTPEKFEYVDTAEPLRRLLMTGDVYVEEIHHIDEDAFTDLVTFPCITTVRRAGNNADSRETRVTLRDGTSHTAVLPSDGSSWASQIRNADLQDMQTGATLSDVTERISPGLATGADNVFVTKADQVPEQIEEKWVRPTVSGSQLREFDGPYTDSVFLCPYRDDGTLADEEELGEFFSWLEDHRERLEDRSCVKSGKTWYAWHETPPMEDILQPKIVFRDLVQEPNFWIEERGTVVPKHSVYYAVPKDGVSVNELVEHLNSADARMWMKANCQRANNGYYRLQSRVLSNLPVPKQWADSFQATL
ncbi:Eco57I restriction-modification methylase domain-containing protein [Halobacterium noricense]|uniref:Eco57I restriction-modification methylase domain-containing protein n=1 Tax=Halobacterium noricense TaxID=223182 RepID=UPI001E55ABA9|nr:TaqI-like C-terminal specificity domain-containing protein [Halobacterium noricense]UHH24549.1 Eco57I restriction-modification methylase domain-containing protein [Halobacterium noricense]